MKTIFLSSYLALIMSTGVQASNCPERQKYAASSLNDPQMLNLCAHYQDKSASGNDIVTDCYHAIQFYQAFAHTEFRLHPRWNQYRYLIGPNGHLLRIETRARDSMDKNLINQLKQQYESVSF